MSQVPDDPKGPGANAWDIVGGPGQRPDPPVQADYMPGGRWYGLVSWDTAQRHYQHARDAFQNGYWYHANGRNWTQQQEAFNNNLTTGAFNTSYGVPTGNLYQQGQDFIDYTYDPETGWAQIPGSGPGGLGGSHGGGAGGGAGGGGTGSGNGGSGSHGGVSMMGLNSGQRGAFDAMFSLLDQFGLADLGPMLKDLILDGITDSASLQLELQQTNTWKQRFAGNEMLRQKGLGVLSPAEYLAVEKSYAQIMRNYGLPGGFYNEPADFAKWIGGNVSAAELQQRVSAYSDLANREDPAVVAQLQSMGLSKGDLLAFTMDPDRAAPLIQRQYQTALLGGAARRAGVVADNEYLGKLAGMGISEQQAGQGYGAIGASMGDARTLSSVYGVDYGQGDMEAEVFENNAGASKKRKRLASQERANFSGSAGVGSLSRDSSGSY